MNSRWKQLVWLLIACVCSQSSVVARRSIAQEATPIRELALPEGYSCSVCHRKEGDLWNETTPITDEKHLADDVHWQKGLLCHDCHGGSPTVEGFKNHRDDPTFRSVKTRDKIPGFCGHCHSNVDYMRKFDPSARTDQEAEYWTSGHGRRLKASAAADPPKLDVAVPTCVDCHAGHGILTVKNPHSRVFAKNVAQTCARCHADAKLMAGRTYHDRPLGIDQFHQWSAGVHGQAMLKKGDLSAPTCNDCHGNHGVTPRGVDSVANSCGTCHGKISKLFAETQMRHKFETSGLPGCATCHGTHETLHPSDALLGMQEGAVCAKCHNAEHPQYGATTAGAQSAQTMRSRLDELKHQIDEAETKIKQAERLGMEIRGPRFDLRQAFESLTNARTQIHSFKPGPVEEALSEGLKVTAEVQERAEATLREHTRRRVWLAASLVPILCVVCLLLLYLRTLPAPEERA
jgi:predicted CXXCH cytochrome family protein